MLRGDQAWNKTVKAAMQFPGLFVARKEPPMNRIRIISRCWRSFAADSNDPFFRMLYIYYYLYWRIQNDQSQEYSSQFTCSKG